MLGVTVASLLELVSGQGIAPRTETFETFTLTIIATLATSGLYALIVSSDESSAISRGNLFLEGVLASLTSTHRSKSSVTSPLNSALDEVVDEILVRLSIEEA
jgi:hypothetical protein